MEGEGSFPMEELWEDLSSKLPLKGKGHLPWTDDDGMEGAIPQMNSKISQKP